MSVFPVVALAADVDADWAVLPFASEATALFLAASEMRMLLRTLVAPLDFAIRVMAPLCCITLVEPSMVATPFTTETVK